MRRILFVDDEPVVLEGLRSMLRKQRHAWQMTFVTDGEAALEELRQRSYDVVVSDMIMPRMNGSELLRHVLEEHPHVVRIVLSGQSDLELSRRLVHVAHQFVAKPCDSNDLRDIVERTCRLRTLLDDPLLRDAVGGVKTLPVRPKVYGELVQLLEKPNISVSDVAAVIERDSGISAKLLQLVNSAFFGLPRRVTDVKTAVSYLGLEMVKTLVLDIGVRQLQASVPPSPSFDVTAIQQHGLLAARIARRLLPDRLEGQDAFAASMLKDVGWLVLLSQLPDRFRAAVAGARASGKPLSDVEEEVLGLDHALIGAYLLGIWGLPYAIVEAVADHHKPCAAESGRFDVVGAVHVAGALAEELVPTHSGLNAGTGARLDSDYIEKLSLADALPEWRNIAREEVARS